MKLYKQLSPGILLGLFLIPSSVVAQAGKISSPTDAEVSKPYSLAFSFKFPPSNVGCGLRIDWGDGVIETFSVGPGRKLQPPYSPVNHTYTAVGKYKIRVQGESVRFSPAPQVPPMPSSPCAIFDEITVSVETRDTGVGQTSGYAKLDEKFSAATFRHKAVWTWGKKDQFGDSRRTMSRCLSLDSAKVVTLYGTETSFRPPELASSEEACDTWLSLSESLIKNENLDRITQKPDGKNQTAISAKYKKNDNLDAIVLKLGSNSYAGWYGVRGQKFFSEGIFISPLKSKPSDGSFQYFGDMTVNRKSVVEIKNFTVNFRDNTISISGRYTMSGEQGEIQTRNPITFDQGSGFFSGELATVEFLRAGRANNEKMLVTGYVGGESGKIVAAMMHNGSVLFREGTGGREPRGFDFFLFQRND